MGGRGCALLLGGASGWEAVLGEEIVAWRKDPERKARWAMVIDTRRCATKGDCTACIDACHRAHNVPRIDGPRHEIKWIWKEPFAGVMPEQDHFYLEDSLKSRGLVVLCNHCGEPPCVRVCPTGATWKREDGIVMMDQHRCIGCRYCMAACPYGARSFNWVDPRKFIETKKIVRGYPTRTKGVVEKCDLCAERIDRGEVPVCVKACAEGALLFGNLLEPGSAVRKALVKGLALRRKPELGTDPGIYYLL